MANTGKGWVGILVDMLPENRRAIDKSKTKIKLLSFPFFMG